MERRNPAEFRKLSDRHKENIIHTARSAWREWIPFVPAAPNLHPSEIRNNLRDAQRRLNQAKSELRENKTEMRGVDKREAYEVIQEVQEKINNAWGDLHEMYRRRTIERIGRLEEALNRKRDALDRREDHMRDLRDKYNSAWSDGYRERVYGWMQDVQAQIDGLRSDIADIERKISDAQGRL